MSLLLASALLAAPATLPSCSWDRPGVNPFVGDVVAAVDRYADIPADVRGRLKARMAQRQYDEIATITRDGIHGQARYAAAIRDMHFGSGQVCNTVTRDRWSDKHQERGLVYCESGHCIIVPTVCRNVSRVTRLESRAEAAEALPAAETLAEKAADEAPANAGGGGDDADEAQPRLRLGGVFGGGIPGPGSAPGAERSGSAGEPPGLGARIAGTVGSVVSSVKKLVRDTLDAVASLPLFGGSETGPAPAPASGIEPSPKAGGADPSPARDPSTPTPPSPPTANDPKPAAPDATPPAAEALQHGGSSGGAADPGPLTPSAPGQGGMSDGAGGSSTPGGSGDNESDGDPVVRLVDEIEQQFDPLPPGDDVPTGGDGGNDQPGGGPIVPGGNVVLGELPEPGTPALLLLAGLAAGWATRRRR